MSAEPGTLSVLNFYLKLGAASGLRIAGEATFDVSEMMWRALQAQWQEDRAREAEEHEGEGGAMHFSNTE